MMEVLQETKTTQMFLKADEDTCFTIPPVPDAGPPTNRYTLAIKESEYAPPAVLVMNLTHKQLRQLAWVILKEVL